MDLIDQLTSELEDLFNVAVKLYENFKKCPKARLTRGYLDVKSQTLHEYWTQFRTAHTSLLKATPREQRLLLPYFTQDHYHRCEEIVMQAKTEIKELLLAREPKPKGSPSKDAGPSSAAYQEHSTAPQVKLPRIQLPTFTGSYEDWPTYQDLFKSLVHSNESISGVQKLHYLKSSISGEAEALLRHIQVNEVNYDVAWTTLVNRYSNKRLIVTSLLKRMFSQRKMTTQTPNQIKSLLDTTSECLSSLKNLEINTENWDPLIIFLVVQRLDTETHKEWEEHVSKQESDDLPTIELFNKFLDAKFRTLELIQQPPLSKTVRSYHASTVTADRVCPLCNENHTLSHCKKFGKMEPIQRTEFVKSRYMCYNCLVPGHTVKACRLTTSCRLCHRRHHSLLHVTKSTSGPNHEREETQPKVFHSNVEDDEISTGEIELAVMTSQTNTTHSTTGAALLATALVEVKSEDGNYTVLRALIDPGSQGCFISERAAQIIKARRYPVKGSIIGVGEIKSKITQVVQVEVQSRCEEFSLRVNAYVISKQLTTLIPTKKIPTNNWPHIKDLVLADPRFNHPAHIDLLLGVNEYAQIVQNEIIKGPPGTPCAQSTALGWILFGRTEEHDEAQESVVVMHHQVVVEDLLKTLWEIDTDTTRRLTKDEQHCEDMYKNTYKRNEDGRYMVRLPFNTENIRSVDGNSLTIAQKRLESLERRFESQPELQKAYKEVMEEYISLKHMEEIPAEEINKKSVYLPHHAVLRPEKETTKTRVVFDASCKGTNGVSLNDELLTGPVLQDDLRSIIMRWRTHNICFVSDIEKMYRMILVHKEDVDFQRVLWRQNTSISDEIKHFRLLTVTFGTASAPYLAIKTLMQLADDEGEEYPVAARMIREDFYVDDLMSGCDTVEEAIEASKQLQLVLSKGNFHLQKWSSNNQQFLRSIETEDRSAKANVDFKMDATIKTLGLSWDLREDEFRYNIDIPPYPTSISKRGVLSHLQKLYDPLGWVAPSIIKAKIFVQRLWLQGIGWDDDIGDELSTEWRTMCNDFQRVNDITLKRWLNTFNRNKGKISLHGFSDASMHAMAAVVYCRVVNDNTTVTTNIVAARTKVAPVKTVSIPRLELCAAVLLSKLLRHVADAMRIPTHQIYAYTDSSVVLSWLYGEPNRWKPFVANRVVEILDNVSNNQWHHVRSECNPADVASRGTTVVELKHNIQWWHGPRWLSEKDITFYTNRPKITPTELERKNAKITVLNIVEDQTDDGVLNFDKYATLDEMLKVIVYMRRFLNFKTNRQTNIALTTKELDMALKTCVKKAQKESFEEEIKYIKQHKEVKSTSKLKSLNPYLDNENILRVGGRLRHANISEERKHPMILDNESTLTLMIIADAHQKTLHGGLQVTLCKLRTTFWILKAKGLVKQRIHKCVICAKVNAKARNQIMGDLPDVRVNPARPFQYSGVDFAGPYDVLMSKGRGAKSNKAYIALFICMCTKAIHLELVGDLTSDAFIAAFRRFVARRGRCCHIWSDQGRNFIGANKELIEAWRLAKLELKDNIAEILALEGTQWHFIPPYSPNFGGLWEAGVKSMKSHLKKVLTNRLTYEEMSTLLCQIESCLNSRPLVPIDDNDVENLNPLTPGHFLVGESTTTVPAPDLTHLNINHLARWQYTQRLLQSFWQNWQTDYLSRLQQRPKWWKRGREFNVNDIVLIKQDNLPPGKWMLGRITDKHPGQDGATRVYSVRSGQNITKRCISKLCPLITNSES